VHFPRRTSLPFVSGYAASSRPLLLPTITRSR
jgi:hypothetical protein